MSVGKHVGIQSIVFQNPVSIRAAASIAGPKEGQGPLGAYFDEILGDGLCGETSWEKAESKIVEKAVNLAITKAGLAASDINYILAGDLLNQCTGSTFGLKDLNIPLFGIFGACSTMGEGLSLGAVLVDGGFADYAAVCASSHFCAAEKQFRFPLELGSQRPPAAGWTVTGAGTAVLAKNGDSPFIKAVTTGKIVDYGVKDINNMGAAMAPAAADTILNHLKDLGRSPEYYDAIVTGDLGYVGRELLIDLLKREGIDVSQNLADCGIEIFDRDAQDTHAGGSGCACSAVTFCGYYYDKLKKGGINRLLLIPTGALLSPTSAQQGAAIPGIAHAVAVEK